MTNNKLNHMCLPITQRLAVVLLCQFVLSACGQAEKPDTHGGDIDQAPTYARIVIESSMASVTPELDVAYTQSNAVFTVEDQGEQVFVRIFSDEGLWGAHLVLPEQKQLVQPVEWPGHGDIPGSVDQYSLVFTGPALLTGRAGPNYSCHSAADFAIEQVQYSQGKLSQLGFRFETSCNSTIEKFSGSVFWNKLDQTKVPGPIKLIPEDFWKAEESLLPADGNYLYIHSSSPDDPVAKGMDWLFSEPEFAFSVSAFDLDVLPYDIFSKDLRVHISDKLAEYPRTAGVLEFVPMNSLNKLEQGYYTSLHSDPFDNPARGKLSWKQDNESCVSSISAMLIDHVSYTNGLISALDARFSHSCGKSIDVNTLYGQLHWRR